MNNTEESEGTSDVNNTEESEIQLNTWKQITHWRKSIHNRACDGALSMGAVRGRGGLISLRLGSCLRRCCRSTSGRAGPRGVTFSFDRLIRMRPSSLGRNGQNLLDCVLVHANLAKVTREDKVQVSDPLNAKILKAFKVVVR